MKTFSIATLGLINMHCVTTNLNTKRTEIPLVEDTFNEAANKTSLTDGEFADQADFGNKSIHSTRQ